MDAPFGYYDPTSGRFALAKDKDTLPAGAQIWPLFRSCCNSQAARYRIALKAMQAQAREALELP